MTVTVVVQTCSMAQHLLLIGCSSDGRWVGLLCLRLPHQISLLADLITSREQLEQSDPLAFGNQGLSAHWLTSFETLAMVNKIIKATNSIKAYEVPIITDTVQV